MLVLKDVFNLFHTEFFRGKSSNQTNTLQTRTYFYSSHENWKVIKNEVKVEG